MGADFSGPCNLPLLFKGGIFIVLLLAASLIDIRKRIIPDTICLAVAMTGFILFEPVKLLGILAALLRFYVIYATIQRLRKRKRQKAFPLAPFLSVGCIAAYFMNTGGITL